MNSRRQFQTADGDTNSAVYPLELYFIRLCVQTAKGRKNHQIFSPSGNCKTPSSQNWSVFSPDGNSVSKKEQNSRRRSALRLYFIWLQLTFPESNLSPYYYVIEYQRVLKLRNRNLQGAILSTN